MEPKRIRHACSRCRRQKLRCDDERPCPLCVRAGAECIEATQRTWRSNRPKSALYQARQRQREEQRGLADPASAQLQQESIASTRGASANDVDMQSATNSVTTTNVEHGDAVPLDQRASALHLVGKIFQKYHAAGASRNHKVDAIPSSDSPEDTQSELIPIEDLIGISLPSTKIVMALLDSYRDSVHWYIRVHHEPSFRARLKPLVESGLASQKQRPLLLLALMVMIFGARYLSDEDRASIDRETSVADLNSNMIVACERWFLPLMDSVTVDTVIYAYLLAAHYLWSRQTRAAFLTLGTTVRAAQFIGLHRESQWGNISDTERETRRCAWWSVFIAAGFMSMSWGTPPMVSEVDCQVGHPSDVEDSHTMERCPGFESMEKREDGELRPVTVGSYNRYKAEMYKIAIAMMRQVYFTKYQNPEDLVQIALRLHQRLLALERSIPPELRVDRQPPIDFEESQHFSLRHIFTIQALTLRVSCDNMYIFLFRPFISVGGMPRSLAGTREPSPGLGTLPSNVLSIAQQQCWTSAMRTSMVTQRPDIVQLSLFKFPALHVGVHAFSAGVMLGLLALLSPLSARGQESKRGVARIIQIPKLTKLTSVMWCQMAEILTDLLHVIAAEETKVLIANPTGSDLTEELAKPEVFGEPTDIYDRQDLPQQNKDIGGEASLGAITCTCSNGCETSCQPGPQPGPLAETGDTTVHTMPPRHYASGPMLAGSVSQHAQYNSQFGVFDTPDFWPPGWSADLLETMDQLWMWDGSISYL